MASIELISFTAMLLRNKARVITTNSYTEKNRYDADPIVTRSVTIFPFRWEKSLEQTIPGRNPIQSNFHNQ